MALSPFKIDLTYICTVDIFRLSTVLCYVTLHELFVIAAQCV